MFFLKYKKHDYQGEWCLLFVERPLEEKEHDSSDAIKLLTPNCLFRKKV